MSHVAPPSPVLSMCSAYFPSPRGCTLFNPKILSVLSVPLWQIHCLKLHRYAKKPTRKSFPCHSYANTRNRGVTPPPKSFSPLATRHSPVALTLFRINTCKSVSKQRALTPLRINTYEKHREGEDY